MNKQEFVTIRKEYREVLLPLLKKDETVCCLGKVWAKKTDYGRIVFRDNLDTEKKEFPDFFYEVGKPGKLNSEELYRMARIIAKEKYRMKKL